MDNRHNCKDQSSKVRKVDNSKLQPEDGTKSSCAVLEHSTALKLMPKTDAETYLRSHVAQLQELTKCSEDQAVTALYDCENNLERAVELVLDKFRCGVEEEWHITVSKRGRSKHASNEAPAKEAVTGLNQKRSNRLLKLDKPENDVQVSPKRVTQPPSPVKNTVGNTEHMKKGNKNRRMNNTRKLSATKNVVQVTQQREPVTPNGTNCVGRQTKPVSEVWDPYADCGDWEGEQIEIINSNVSIAMGLQEKPNDPLPGDKSEHEREERAHLCPISEPEMSDSSRLCSLFTNVAKSKPPPKALGGFSDVSLFIAPEILPSSNCKWKPTFGCDSFKIMLTESSSCTDTVVTPHVKDLVPPTNVSIDQSDISKQFSYTPHAPNPGFELKNASPLTALLENSSKNEEKSTAMSTDLASRHFDESITPKVPISYPSASKKQAQHLVTSNSTDQSMYLEPIKNLLDGLSENMDKLNVEEAKIQNSKSPQYNIQAASQSQQVHTFAHNQNSPSAIQHPLSKIPQPHPNAHVPSHTQPITTNSQQPHPQSTALPPGMTHFISQFPPTAYHMFNLAGGSNTGPTLFDLDHLQLLQQQRMLYDMHLQHQTATTAQNMTQTQDPATSGKSVSHNLPGPMSHVTAANAGMRSDILTPAIGHTPQMVTPGHPYFPYPGFVVMNGYPNAFVNQQQQQQQPSTDNAQSQNSGHCGSPITQHQPQQSTAVSPYNNLKQLNASVGNYEDILDMKYGDPTKQVGFKTNSNQTNYGSFQSQTLPVDNVGNKLSGNHSGSGSLGQNFVHPNSNSHTQHFPPQFYPSVAAASPYLTAVAAVAVAAAKQASNNNVGANQPNPPNVSGNQTGVTNNGPSQLHMNSNTQGMVLGSSGPGLHHHQRTAIPHQH